MQSRLFILARGLGEIVNESKSLVIIYNFDKLHIINMSSASTSSSQTAGLKLLTVERALDETGLLREGFSLEDAAALSKCARWTTTYPLQRVKKRRRVEAICPMMAPALAARGVSFTLAPMDERETPLERLDDLLRQAARLFETRMVCDDPRLRCLVVVVPGVRGGRLLEATTPDREIKNELLGRGILVGEFFPSCPFATTFNPRLFALRSPAPMYVLRSFMESDWRFICQIPAWQRTYRARFGEPPAKLRHLGGPIWRLKQKIGWRVDAVRQRLFPRSPEPIEPDP